MLYFLIPVCITSVAINVLLVWYLRRLGKRSSLLSSVTNEVVETLGEYERHIKAVHELPLFYGDATLQGLMDHTGGVIEELNNYKDGFQFGTFQEEEDVNSETTTEED